MQLTKQQKSFFDTFGYLIFRGLFRDEIEHITAEFRGVFDDRGVEHDASKRTCMVPFADQRAGLCALLDDPRIDGIAGGLLGDDYNYIVGDGNYYSGDTGWHSDGYHTVNTYLKIAFYLDPVGHDSGALRVLPGSHLVELENWSGRSAGSSAELWNMHGREVPAVTLDSQPGDVVVFNHNLMHAAFGGSTQRRMFTINFCNQARTPDEVKDVRDFIAVHSRFWLDSMHGDVMRATASEKRMRHLRQIMELENHLPELSAKARLEMAEPARG